MAISSPKMRDDNFAVLKRCVGFPLAGSMMPYMLGLKPSSYSMLQPLFASAQRRRYAPGVK